MTVLARLSKAGVTVVRNGREDFEEQRDKRNGPPFGDPVALTGKVARLSRIGGGLGG